MNTAWGIWCEWLFNHLWSRVTDKYFQVYHCVPHKCWIDNENQTERLQWKRNRKILHCFHSITLSFSSLIWSSFIFLASIQRKSLRSRELVEVCCMHTDSWQQTKCTLPKSFWERLRKALLPSDKAHCLHLGDFLSEPLGAVSSQLEGWREMCTAFGLVVSGKLLSGMSLV